MWCDHRLWLATLRTRRRAVLCAWLPVLVLSAASGPACAAMRAGEPVAHDAAMSPHPAHHAAAPHQHHGHTAANDSPPASQQPHSCPHCPLTSAANVGHDVCAATESPDHSGFVVAKDTTERLQLALAPNWRLPAARAAPPLIANVHPPPAPLAAAVPLRITHCVLVV